MHDLRRSLESGETALTAGLPPGFEQYRPFTLVTHCGRRILAVGADLKSGLCLYHGSAALLSPTLGNLSDPRDYRRFVETIQRVQREFDFHPELVACDLHPAYQSSSFARAMGLPIIGVQHHHAHVVSVMAEWWLDKPVIGVCCDGVGYGTDGAAWGCEVLRCEPGSFERLGHLDYFPLVGGDSAAIDTWRPAAALVRQAFGQAWRANMPHEGSRLWDARLNMLDKMMAARAASPMTSSLGRVFDAVGFLLGLCERNEREAQAAIALEQAADPREVDAYPYETAAGPACTRMSLVPAIRALVRDRKAGAPIGVMAARFHETVARMLATTAEMAADGLGLRTVVLAGGCFANRRLLERITARLEARHLKVLWPRRVPCGDAGLALGQAVAAGAFSERRS